MLDCRGGGGAGFERNGCLRRARVAEGAATAAGTTAIEAGRLPRRSAKERKRSGLPGSVAKGRPGGRGRRRRPVPACLRRPAGRGSPWSSPGPWPRAGPPPPRPALSAAVPPQARPAAAGQSSIAREPLAAEEERRTPMRNGASGGSRSSPRPAPSSSPCASQSLGGPGILRQEFQAGSRVRGGNSATWAALAVGAEVLLQERHHRARNDAPGARQTVSRPPLNGKYYFAREVGHVSTLVGAGVGLSGAKIRRRPPGKASGTSRPGMLD